MLVPYLLCALILLVGFGTIYAVIHNDIKYMERNGKELDSGFKVKPIQKRLPSASKYQHHSYHAQPKKNGKMNAKKKKILGYTYIILLFLIIIPSAFFIVVPKESMIWCFCEWDSIVIVSVGSCLLINWCFNLNDNKNAK